VSAATDESGAGWAVFNVLADTAIASYIALAGTLLFFDLRARDPEAWVDAPESLPQVE
jgi:hypothetical protein